MKHSRHGRPAALAEIKFKEYAEELRGKGHREIFSFIHEINLWGAHTSRSGLGSELQATEPIRNQLKVLLSDLKVKVMLDIPCGDFGWLRHASLPISKYIGADILESKIKELSNEFKDVSEGISYVFKCLDITKDPLPAADLLFCRDCLVHFSYDFVGKALKNIKISKSRYLLTTTFTDLSKNIDVQDGDWRPLNLELEPFNFPKPKLVLNEQCTEVNGAYADKSLGLWEIASLPKWSKTTGQMTVAWSLT